MPSLTLVIFLLFSSISYGATTSLSQLVYVTEEFYPFNYTEEDAVTGFAVELLELVFTHILLEKPDVKVLPWARGYKMLGTEDDVVLFTTANTPIRHPLFQWACPIKESQMMFFALASNRIEINELDDAKQYMVGTLKSFATDQYLRGKGFKPPGLLAVDTTEQNINKLLMGRIDLVAGLKRAFYNNLDRLGHKPAMLREVYTLQRNLLCYTFSKNVPKHLVEQFQAGLSETRNSAQFKALEDKYFGDANAR